MRFTWDDRKARTNASKHGVSFEEAITAFTDERARMMYDPDHSQEEDRFVLLGMSVKLRLLVVCHVHRCSDEEMRIISARKATRRESKQYGSLL